jgi:hypothetical protein
MRISTYLTMIEGLIWAVTGMSVIIGVGNESLMFPGLVYPNKLHTRSGV